MNTLGKRIKRLRFNKGESIRQTSEALYLTQSTYARIERDEITPHELIIKRIAAHFEVTPEYLINEHRITLRLASAISNFFIHNRGKVYRILAALGVIASVLFPLLECFDTSGSDNPSTIIENNNIENVVIGDSNTIIQYKRTDSIIELVDLSIIEDGEFPVLDIKLRNSGDTVAYLYKLEVNMIDYFQMHNIYDEYHSYVEPSSNYDIILTERATQDFTISQKIPANDVDRFTVSMATTTGDPYFPAICVFSIRLYYNNDGYVESTAMIIPVGNPKRIGGKFIASTNNELAYKNYQNLIRINDYDAVKSDHFTKILQSYVQNKDVFS